jgi:sRNA-binding carbon storage regulator CsrA
MRVKEGDRIQLDQFEVFIERVGHRNVHIGIEAPKELTIVRQKKARLKKSEPVDRIQESPP